MAFLEVPCNGASFSRGKKIIFSFLIFEKKRLPVPQGPLERPQISTNMVPEQANRPIGEDFSRRELTNQWYSTTTKYQVCTYPVPRCARGVHGEYPQRAPLATPRAGVRGGGTPRTNEILRSIVLSLISRPAALVFSSRQVKGGPRPSASIRTTAQKKGGGGGGAPPPRRRTHQLSSYCPSPLSENPFDRCVFVCLCVYLHSWQPAVFSRCALAPRDHR